MQMLSKYLHQLMLLLVAEPSNNHIAKRKPVARRTRDVRPVSVNLTFDSRSTPQVAIGGK